MLPSSQTKSQIPIQIQIPIQTAIQTHQIQIHQCKIRTNPTTTTTINNPKAIEDALTMSEEERRERHRQNFMHVATHTAQVIGDW